MRRLLATALAALVAAAVLVAALGSCERRPERQRLTIATGGAGGVYHAYGTGLAEMLADELGAEVEVLATAASVENLRLVAQGEADLCFALSDAAALAVRGDTPFSPRRPVAALARLYDNYTHLVVDAELDIHHLTDLRGRAVSTGAADSGTDLMAERLLNLAGLDPNADVIRSRLSLGDSTSALRHGEIAAFFWSGGLPTGAITELAASTPIRLIDLAEYIEPLRTRYGDLFTELSIPAFTYGLPHEVATIGVPNLLIVHESMDAGLAETLTRLLFDNRERLVTAHPEAERLNHRVAVATYPVPLHPGAAAYFRSSKPHA